MSSQPPRQNSLVIFDVVGSTNESILTAGRDGKAEGTTHLARQQTRGRGRVGHRWWSPRNGGLWMSVLLRPHTPRARWGGLTMVAAAAVYDVISNRGIRDLRLYWPNDLQIGSRKLGGLLGEIGSAASAAWVALGIGLNLRLDPAITGEEPPAEFRETVTSLDAAGATGALDAPHVALEILEHLWPLYDAFQDGQPVSEILGKRLAHVGGHASVRVTGQPERRGRVVGLGPLGELLVEVSQADRRADTKAGPREQSVPPESAGHSLSTPEVLTVVSGDVTYEGGELG